MVGVLLIGADFFLIAFGVQRAFDRDSSGSQIRRNRTEFLTVVVIQIDKIVVGGPAIYFTFIKNFH